jgi:4-amino-4-deoxy-L-arabinose transferase-like glycosyltransferase
MTRFRISNSRRALSGWPLIVFLLLLAWGLRLCLLETVPPGWRDDALINIHALSGEVLDGRFPLYFTGASGHEPLYHYLHAGVHAVLGFNVLSGQIPSIMLGTLSVALTYTLTRRLFGRSTATIASLTLAMSFWSLMYSRTAIRHISLPPFALAIFYVLWRLLEQKPQHHESVKIQTPGLANWGLAQSAILGILLGLSLYTYPAARLLPVLLVVFLAYLALVRRELFNRHWRSLLLSLAVMVCLVAPLGVAIAQGTSEAAAQGIGADARLAELAVPLRELGAGNPRPLLENVLKTLGMFHTTGDPEWLYNISGRPVFNIVGGTLLWIGVALCLFRWRQPRYFFLLLWLVSGLLPTFLSTPAASLSHTILAQPVAYILPALTLSETRSWIAKRDWGLGIRKTLPTIAYSALIFLCLATNAARDLWDYFLTWPEEEIVRILYRADYREAASYLNAHPEKTDVAISSGLMGPWDRLALDVDIRREEVAVRLFNPERALIWIAEETPATVLLVGWPPSAPLFDRYLGTADQLPQTVSPSLRLHVLPGDPIGQPASLESPARFANNLELIDAHWMDSDSLAPGKEAILVTVWRVTAPVDLPPMPIIANPPPPGVYSGPRLAVFTHLLASDGTTIDGDDGLWVDPLTLRPGDRFLQAHFLVLPPDAPAGPYTLELGLYDPKTGDRWVVLSSEGQPAADRVLLFPEEDRP